jgi:peptidoglycan/xylan/chitin deacetylase (PgdA/CDA1 family)
LPPDSAPPEERLPADSPPYHRLRRFRRLLGSCAKAVLASLPLNGRVFWRLPPSASGVALTFDDGPHPEITPAVLDLLKSHRAQATFFVVGKEARRYPEIVRRIVAEGHSLGNHTYSHPHCDRVSPDQLIQEIEAADEILGRVGEQRGPLPFRPPYGDLRAFHAWRILRGGRPIVHWSQDCRDYTGDLREVLRSVSEIRRTLRDRDVVLLHDDSPLVLEALPHLLEELSERGLRTVTLSGYVSSGRQPARTPMRLLPKVALCYGAAEALSLCEAYALPVLAAAG